MYRLLAKIDGHTWGIPMLNHVVVGSGSPLLILHGSGLDHRHMMETLEPICERLEGWKRVYVDLPGHGQSRPQDRIKTQDDLLAVIIEFADEALPDQKFGIVGESRGSYLAQGFVHMQPDRISGAALIVPGGSPASDSTRLPDHQVLESDPSMRSELNDNEIARFESFMVVQRRDILERSRRSKYPAFDLCDEAQTERVNRSFDFSFHARGETTKFDGPSMIVAGRQDSMSGYLDAIDLLPQFTHATLAVLDAAGHGLAWERPEVFDALFRDWLARLSRCK
ncbi:MAG: alpha/beta hydrolase [Rhizobiaceae bacterium]